jgi:hypothetical protein
MKPEEFKNSVKALLRNSDFEKDIDKAINCGAIDVENQNPEDFTTRKALVCVILRNAANQWAPISKEGRDEVKNLERFI